MPLTELVPDSSGVVPPTSVTREEYLTAVDRLAGVFQIADGDREAAWLRFAVVRSSYDEALRGLAGLTYSIPAPWTTDRPAVVGRPRLLTNKPVPVDWTLPARPAAASPSEQHGVDHA